MNVPPEVKKFSRHLTASMRVVANRITFLLEQSEGGTAPLSEDRKDELRHLHEVLRPVMDNLSDDWKQVVKNRWGG